MNMVNFTEILTDDELSKAVSLYSAISQGDRPGPFAQTCADEIIQPAIGRINTHLGQKNDPKFLAYALEFALGRAG